MEILDCTLRDASYPIAYQFTAEDTAVIAAALENAGFRLIEIGHGLGLGASSAKYGIAAATDEDYLSAAASVLTKAKFGVFAIPGIATIEMVKTAARLGAGFVRIGTDVTATESAEKMIREARDLGLSVSANLMKTYAAPPSEVARRAEILAGWGADVVCIVDSAGGMLPKEVASYVEAVRAATPVRVGFHGHNNLQLGLANTLAAVDAGATVVDSTIRGLGRSAGNTHTEPLVLILQKMGYELNIDWYRMMDIGERLIGPLAGGRRVDPLELASGYAKFHSGFNPLVEKVAAEEGLDVRELVIRVSELEQINVTEDLVRQAARMCTRSGPAKGEAPEVSFDVRVNSSEAGENPASRAGAIGREMRSLAKKSGRDSVFTIARSARQPPATAFPFVRVSGGHVVGHAEVANIADAVAIATAVDGVVDAIVVDAEGDVNAALVGPVRKTVSKSPVHTYRDTVAQVDAAELLVAQFAPPYSVVGVVGESPVGDAIAARLVGRGYRVASRNGGDDEGTGALELLVVAPAKGAAIDLSQVERVAENGTIIDAIVGVISPQAIARARERGLRLVRLDMRAALGAHVAMSLESADLVERQMGSADIAGVPVVAGGIIGKRGEVVVDSIATPTRVIGIAAGDGRLLGSGEAAEFAAAAGSVRGEIMRRRLV